MSKSSRDLPYGRKRDEEEKGRVDKILGRKDGGRVKADDGTNIHIEINAEPKQTAEDLPMPGPLPPMPPPMAGPPPPMPPPGLGPGMPPGGAGGGPIAGLKRGGAVKRKLGGAASMDAGAGSGEGRLEKIGKKA